jgi:hypothetical protein
VIEDFTNSITDVKFIETLHPGAGLLGVPALPLNLWNE